MASKAQAKLQPWQLYNPLDKSAVVPNIPQSNKFPYNKEPSRTSPLHPKITSVGVVPPRNSMEMSDLKVMLVGNTIGETTKDTGRLETQKVVTDTCKEYRSSENGTKIQHKMPAIIASEGTTTRPSFAVRAKPPPMPRSKPAVIKRKRSLIISKASTKIPSAKKSNSDYTVASPSENLPVEPAKSAVSIEVTDHSVTPIRSIDEMIQTLRSSRQASATSKSLSDQKIDEILQQVMMHAEEWISDSNTEAIENLEERELNCTPRSDEDESVMKDSQEIKETKKGVHIGSTESDIDVSDTVSTLASQISAPAGIPDVTTILARKSSQALRGQSSQMSESSSPFMIVHEEEDITDKEQCLKDLNMSLDVSNCDILNIQGCHPPLVEKPAVIGKEKDFSESRDIPLKPTHHIGGKIHRLCLLPRIKELTVTPSEFALSKVMHSNPDTDISSYGDANPYLNLPKQNAAASQHKPTATEEPKKKGQDISNYLDTSKLDPLDIDGWRRVVEGEFEKRDYTVEGERSEISNWTAWRMMWTVVPPKMALTTSAVKALVFPNYHGTRFPNVDVEESENWNADDNLSQIMSEDEEKHQFNERTLNRRHFSVNDLTKTVSSNFSLQRSSSAPNLAERSYSGSSKIMVKTDYTTAMFEVKEQRESVLKQHMSMLEKQANIEANQEASLETYVYERQPEQEKQKAKTFNKPVAPFVSGISFKDEATQRVSLTAQAMNSGRKFIVHSKKKSKSRRSKRFIKNIRKTLLSVRPYSLARSQSADSFLPVSTVASSSPSSSRSKRTSTKLNGKIKRSTSVPRMEEFSWFISRHQKYGEKIEDMREWVRDIWNVWFDEVFPPESEDYSSVYEVEEDTDDLLDTAEKEEENRAREDAKKIPVPDVIAPALSTMPEDVDEPEEVMRAAVIQLTEEISNLRSHETSMKSFHLAKRGSLFRKFQNYQKGEV